MNPLSLILLLIKLAFANFKFGLKVLAYKLNRFHAVVFLYALLFLQGLVVLGSLYFQQQKLSFFEIQQQKESRLKKDLDFDKLPSKSTTTFNLNSLQAEKLLSEHHRGLKQSPNNRDLLINTAVLELKVNNDWEKYLELIERAHNSDPNWSGWKE